MADQKLSIDDVLKQIVMLRKTIEDQGRTIAQMQRNGGFADSKTHSMRATRIEERLELLELDSEMVKDVLAIEQGFIEHHLKDRHDVDNIDRDDAPDVVPWRRIRARMRAWAEKRGLMTKRRDIGQVRRDENRVRPSVPA